MATKELSANHLLVEEINFMKDKKLAVKLSVLSSLPFVLFIVGYTWANDGEVEFFFGLTDIVLFVMGYILVIILHELIHGLAFKHFNKDKVKYGFKGVMAYAACPGWFFSKAEYTVISLAPAVVVNVLLLGLLFVISGTAFTMLLFLLVLHICGCVGDFYVFYRLKKHPYQLMVEDTDFGMRFFK